MASLDNVFHSLHQQGLRILANVADAGGARQVERMGSKAIATSSAAMTWAHGYQDGDKLPIGLLGSAVGSMTRVVSVPLTVDIEGGYSDDLAHVAKVVATVIDADAVGINIEDGIAPPELLIHKIDTARRVAGERGINLFVNVRCDVYLKNLFPVE